MIKQYKLKKPPEYPMNIPRQERLKQLHDLRRAWKNTLPGTEDYNKMQSIYRKAQREFNGAGRVVQRTSPERLAEIEAEFREAEKHQTPTVIAKRIMAKAGKLYGKWNNAPDIAMDRGSTVIRYCEADPVITEKAIGAALRKRSWPHSITGIDMSGFEHEVRITRWVCHCDRCRKKRPKWFQ